MNPIVTTTAGAVEGRRVGGVDRYLGIPYAAAPVGALRFLPPVPAAPWNGVLDAGAFGPTAPQPTSEEQGALPAVVEPIIPGDGCLNLNVWTPADDAGPHPVLVWIHGGGFVAGSSANPWYDGASFARRGLVFVSLNYRLGADGFLALEGAPPNRGVLDWIAALQWVREEIAAFGGDPAQVTIMGQSAGGAAVSVLLDAPDARGLFHRAVIASGVSDVGVWSAGRAHEIAQAVTTRVGIEATLEEAIAVEPARFVRAHLDVVAASGGMIPPWAPVVDGALVRRSVLDAVTDEAFTDIPVLVGCTANEFAWMGYDPDDAAARAAAQATFADAIFREPVRRFVEARTGAPAPTYRYEFQWVSTAERAIGSAHALDIPFFFHALDASYVAGFTGDHPPQHLADEMHAAFARFASSGEPGWPAYTPGGAVMLFGERSRIAPASEICG